MEPCRYMPVLLTATSISASRFLQVCKRFRNGWNSGCLLICWCILICRSKTHRVAQKSQRARHWQTRYWRAKNRSCVNQVAPTISTCQCQCHSPSCHQTLIVTSKMTEMNIKTKRYQRKISGYFLFHLARIPFFWLNRNIRQIMTLKHLNVCQILLNSLRFFFKYSATVLSWPSDTPSPPPLTVWRQSEETVRSFNCIDKVRTEDPNPFVDMVRNKLAAPFNFEIYFTGFLLL